MNEQNTFNVIVSHLMKQKARAVSDVGNCMYRGKNNMKCAVGCLIPDNLYDPKFEGRILVGRPSLVNLLEGLGHNIELLSELQYVHDKDSVEHWLDNLTNVGEEFNLNTKLVRWK